MTDTTKEYKEPSNFEYAQNVLFVIGRNILKGNYDTPINRYHAYNQFILAGAKEFLSFEQKDKLEEIYQEVCIEWDKKMSNNNQTKENK